MHFSGLVVISLNAQLCMGVQIHPAYPTAIQPSWQASVPVPININYDVPNFAHFEEEQSPLTASRAEQAQSTGFAETNLEKTSFAITPEHLLVQAVTPEQFSIRLHPPHETIQQSLDGVEAVSQLSIQDDEENRKRYEASKQQLFDAMSNNIKRIVRESLAPLSSLRNPET